VKDLSIPSCTLLWESPPLAPVCTLPTARESGARERSSLANIVGETGGHREVVRLIWMDLALARPGYHLDTHATYSPTRNPSTRYYQRSQLDWFLEGRFPREQVALSSGEKRRSQ